MANKELQQRIDEEKTRLLNTDKEFAQYSIKHDAATAFRKYLMDDAISLPMSSWPVQGRELIYNGMKSNSSEYILSWQPQYADVSSSLDLGYTWGFYTSKNKSSGNETKGQYLNVWKKTSDGWRVAIDMGNEGPNN